METKKVQRTDYNYDNRGNLIEEAIEGNVIQGYKYGAMNRLSKSWNAQEQEAFYLYNGMGQRTGKRINGEEEDYLLDLTRGYQNLLGIYKDESNQYFYYDKNLIAMEKTNRRIADRGERNFTGRIAFSRLHYYLQDEMGSHIRVSGFSEKKILFLEQVNTLLMDMMSLERIWEKIGMKSE